MRYTHGTKPAGGQRHQSVRPTRNRRRQTVPSAVTSSCEIRHATAMRGKVTRVSRQREDNNRPKYYRLTGKFRPEMSTVPVSRQLCMSACCCALKSHTLDCARVVIGGACRCKACVLAMPSPVSSATFGAVCVLLLRCAAAVTNPVQKQALVDLYHATDGPNWAHKWALDADPCVGSWFGVQCGSDDTSV